MWCEIPAGSVIVQKNTEHIAGFYVTKSPVTNAQFAKFMEAGGYEHQQWWTDDGWQARLAGWDQNVTWKPSGKPWTEPRDWGANLLNGSDYPVTGVSWHEAIAFCNWCNQSITSDEWSMTLPTKQQGQRIMQMPDTINKFENVWEWSSGDCEPDPMDSVTYDEDCRVLYTDSPAHPIYSTTVTARLRFNPFEWFNYEFSFRLVLQMK